MLMTPMTPNVMASPMAASSSTEPSERPYQAFCTALHMASRPSIDLMASVGGALDRIGRIVRQAGQQPARLLVAAVAHDRDRLELVGGRRVRLIEHDGGPRLGECALDPWIRLLRNRRVEGRKRRRFARLEHRLRGVETFAGIGGEQGQAAESSVDRAPQPIIDPYGLEPARCAAGHRPPAACIENFAGFLPNVDFLVVGIEQQAPILQGFDHLRRQRIAAGRHRIDRGFGVAVRSRWQSLRARRRSLARAPSLRQTARRERRRAPSSGRGTRAYPQIPAVRKRVGDGGRPPAPWSIVASSYRICWSWC